VVLFVGNMLVSDSALDYFGDHLDVLWKVPLAVAVLSLYYATIGCALASLTDRRIVAGASVIGLFLLTSISSSVIVGDSSVEGGGYGGSSTCWRCPLHLRDVIFLGHIDPDSPLSGVAGGGLLALACYLVVLCTGAMVLWWRYRWVER
jgi:hypothetical protein